MNRSLLLIFGVLLVAMLAPRESRAGEARAPSVDWARVILELDAKARGTAAELSSPVATRIEARTSQIAPQNLGNAWFGVAPRVALVARDWGAAFHVAGDRLSLVDSMRLSASTRMVMTRVRTTGAGSAKVVPFLQLGAGQWRTDPNVLPLTPRSTELAAQVGAGLEVSVSQAWQVACETSGTLLVRESREASSLPQTKLWSMALASRFTF